MMMSWSMSTPVGMDGGRTDIPGGSNLIESLTKGHIRNPLVHAECVLAVEPPELHVNSQLQSTPLEIPAIRFNVWGQGLASCT
jgi:hypothetical protein